MFMHVAQGRIVKTAQPGSTPSETPILLGADDHELDDQIVEQLVKLLCLGQV